MSCNTLLLAQMINTGSRLGDLSLATLLFLVPILLLVGGLFLLRRMWRVRLPELRKLPQNDQEKLKAVELTLKGIIFCVLGLFFPPLILFGIVPLYYGGRKLAAIRLGIEDAEEDENGGRS